MTSEIQLDVLLKGPRSPDVVTSSNVAGLRPAPEAIERCFRFLAARGLTCHRATFGITCSGPAKMVEAVFGSHSTPRPPQEIAELIDQVTLSQPPELF